MLIVTRIMLNVQKAIVFHTSLFAMENHSVQMEKTKKIVVSKHLG